MKSLLRAINKKERMMVAAASLLVMLATSLPPLYGFLIGLRRGLVWSGIQFLSPGDFAVYLSYIEQAKAGSLLFENFFTTEQLLPALNILWLAVGLPAKWLSLSAVAAFHAARILLIPALCAAGYALISFFYDRFAERMAAFFLFIFASGVGLYFEQFFSANQPAGGSYEWPIDLWVAESNTFLTMLYSPHFIASLTLILLSFLFLLKAFENGKPRHAAAAGLLALVLFEFHPFHALTVYAVPAAYLFLRLARGESIKKRAALYLIFFAISLPSVAYHYYLTHYSELARSLTQANLTPTPAVWHLVIGYGAMVFLAAAGYRFMRGAVGAGPRRDFLVVWIVTQVLLVYAPLTFQRRLLEGLQFPLAVLSAAALVELFRRGIKKYGRAPAMSLGLLLCCVLFLPSTFLALARSFSVYRTNTPPIFFFTKQESEALNWLRESTEPDAVVLASFESGNRIAGWAGKRVYAGHWERTAEVAKKMMETQKFYGTATAEERVEFLKDRGISYVYVGPAERQTGFAASPPLTEVFRSGDIAIYNLRP